MAGEKGWLAFWQDRGGTLFAGERHRRAHARLLAWDYAALIADPSFTVMDFGPGEALAALELGSLCRQLLLCEAAQTARVELALRFRSHPAIAVIGPDDLSTLPARTVDLIILHSVMQYVSPADVPDLLGRFARLLTPDGCLVIGDIISPDDSVLDDVRDLLVFAWRERFLAPALRSLLRLPLSMYGRYRRVYGLSRYDDASLHEILRASGFQTTRLARNLGHAQSRAAYMACLSDAALEVATMRAPNRTSDSA